MYYPYLRGRQFELIALREFAIENPDNSIIPIIEPVKKTFNSLKIAISIFKENSQKFALVLNPKVGELKNNPKEIIDQFVPQTLEGTSWIPTFIVTNNYDEVLDMMEQYSEVMLICTDQTDSSNKKFLEIVESPKSEYFIFEENRTLKRLIRKENKKTIRLDDNFKPQKRNSDYLDLQEEKLSEEHIYYTEDGYNGFSDYTVISSIFQTGGSLPFAISIHLSYAKQNQEIWIRHFTSESNNDNSNIQGKFAEAARKTIMFLKENNLENSAINELKYDYDHRKYPGLGTLKKIIIKNHLEIVNTLLTEG